MSRKKNNDLSKKITYNRSISKGVVIEFQNVMDELGVDNTNEGLEFVMKQFCDEYRQSKEEALLKKNLLGKDIKWDINE